MGIGTFIKLIQAMGADTNDLLGSVPEVGKKQYRDRVHRISHLKAADQEIVWRTVYGRAEEFYGYGGKRKQFLPAW